MEIKGKVALVTGGAIHIGHAISEALLEKGAQVAIHCFRSKGGAFQADLSKMSEIEKLVEDVEKSLGPIDILINNAAIFERAPLSEISEENFDRHILLNLKAPLFLSQRVASSMLKQKRGKIINIADDILDDPHKNHLSYCISKGGLLTLTKGLAKELAPHVQVNAVAPGIILPQEQRAVANAVIFLIENDSATGSVVTINDIYCHQNF